MDVQNTILEVESNLMAKKGKHKLEWFFSVIINITLYYIWNVANYFFLS